MMRFYHSDNAPIGSFFISPALLYHSLALHDASLALHHLSLMLHYLSLPLHDDSLMLHSLSLRSRKAQDAPRNDNLSQS
jgi:hypothetical protein